MSSIVRQVNAGGTGGSGGVDRLAQLADVSSIGAQVGQVVAVSAVTDGAPTFALTGGTGQVQVRQFSGAWPVRGVLPAGTVVIWVKRVSTDPDPSIDSTFMLAGVDILLSATA